jgi:hypothetical protein
MPGRAGSGGPAALPLDERPLGTNRAEGDRDCVAVGDLAAKDLWLGIVHGQMCETGLL